ncbi:MAG: MgtC family protein [Parcubacteria group bacterium GW2011_GWA1_47_10]|nr:MAG: MgtC family protein [Parcubacteria group bacterium GW2011_GWA1_47_10]
MINLLNISPAYEPLAYLVLALVLGSLLGMERTLAHKTAGVRTYGLVSMGSALFILIAKYVIPTVEAYNYDPMRIAAGVVMGIGFLCGGGIIFKDSQLSGLTTAAGLWVAAGIGMAVGYGLVMLAVFATAATLVVFTLFWFIEHKIISRT